MSLFADPGSRLSWRESNSWGVFLTALTVGIISGLVCVSVRFALRLLQWMITGHAGLLADAAAHLPLWRRVLTPVLGAILATLIVKGAQRFFAANKSVDYVEAVRFYGGCIPLRITFWRTVSSMFSISSGAAIGREGSMIQFSAACIAALGLRWNKRIVPLDRLVSLGAAAAVAAVYQAPLAGVFFALEIVIGLSSASKGALLQMPALLIAAGSGALVSRLFLGSGPLFAVSMAVHFGWHDLIPALLSAAIIGSLGPAYLYVVEGLRWMKKLPWAMVWSGLIVGLLSCIRTETWGNGDSAVLTVMNGTAAIKIVILILAIRLIATAACVGSGVVGGVFTPTVFAGSVLGFLYGNFLHTFFGQASPVDGYAVLGIACLLASVTHAPLMAALMTIELTGTSHWFPVMLLGSLLSFQIARAISTDSLYAVATPDPARLSKMHGTRTTPSGEFSHLLKSNLTDKI